MEEYNIENRKRELEALLKENIINKVMMEEQIEQFEKNIEQISTQINSIRAVLIEISQIPQ